MKIFPKKPERLYLHNPNLMYATRMIDVGEQVLYAVDGIEKGEANRIPLWLFGFMY